MHFSLTYFSVAILIFLAGINIFWGHGGLWPGKNDQDLVDKIFGEGNEFPSIAVCYFVAIGLLILNGYTSDENGEQMLIFGSLEIPGPSCKGLNKLTFQEIQLMREIVTSKAYA